MERIIPISVDNKFAYNIFISFNFDKLLDNIIDIKPDKATKIAIVTDSNVEKIYSSTVRDILSSFYNDVLIYSIPAGEENKSLETVGGLYEYLIKVGFERSDMLLALGGGVIGDMTGFAAATYMRGIDYIQVPTTLLSQVDSSIGGKTAVDCSSCKNMVGAFYYPRLVYINTGVLDSLDDEQFACGMGEVIKYGLIMDRDFYDWLGANKQAVLSKDKDALLHTIYTSCCCKKKVVEEDPTEKGIRAILNFGHTIGHAIEALSEFTLYHGQCVAIGMMAAMYLSASKGYIDEKEPASLRDMLISYGLPYNISQQDVDTILRATGSDKKMTHGRIRFILLEAIGSAIISSDLTDDDLKYAIGRVVA